MRTNRLTIIIKGTTIVEILVIILMVVLVGGNAGTHDYETFYQSYYNIIQPSFETGFLWLENAFFLRGVNYNTFRLIICIFNILITYSIAKKYNPSSLLFLILFFFYPLPHDGAYLRNTIAKCIIYIAMQVSMDSRLRRRVLSLIMIIFASLFHRIAIVYIIPLLIWFYLQTENQSARKRFVKVSVSIIVIVAVAAAFYRPLLDLFINYMAQMSFFTGSKQVYLTVMGNYGFLIMGGIQAGYSYLLYLCYLQLKENEHIYGECTNVEIRTIFYKTKRFTYMVFIFCVSLLFMIAVYKINSNYFRVFRNLAPLATISILASMRLTKGSNIKRERIIRLGLISVVIICFVVDILGSKSALWDSMFIENWILGQ